jgi:hypothetical protein
MIKPLEVDHFDSSALRVKLFGLLRSVERVWSKFGGEVPGQELLDAVDGMIGDAL